MLKKWLRKWLLEESGKQAETGYADRPAINTLSKSNSALDRDESLNFSVHHALGGKIVQFTTYDIVSDRRQNKLYVIHDEDDLSNELGKIVTMEYMRQGK